MATVKAPSSFQNLSTIEELRRFVSAFVFDLLRQVNGNLNFGANVAASGPFVVNFTTANADTQVGHNLNRTPTGFLIVNTSAAMRIFQGSTSWSKSQIYLQSDAVGKATVYVI